MNRTYMLDTNICSFVLRQRPESVLQRLQEQVNKKNQIVISAITYAEMCFGAIGKKASPKHADMVSGFVSRLDGILPWDAAAVEETTKVKARLYAIGTPIGPNDAAIAGHSLATKSILVTNNQREFRRVDGLIIEDWVVDG